MTTEPKERPILFSAPMVRAILDGRKTVTRRLVTVPWRGSNRALPYGPCWVEEDGRLLACDEYGDYHPAEQCLCGYGPTGDHLWVREAFAPVDKTGHKCNPHDAAFVVLRDGAQIYRDGFVSPALTEYQQGAFDGIKWRPSIHMPRWASRILLEIVDVRIERLHAITDADARAEGLALDGLILPGHAPAVFAKLWDEINGSRAPWSSNPWVWRIEFSTHFVRQGSV